MTNKIFKKTTLALIICACLFSLTLFVTKAGSVSGISYLNASVGETYDTVGIAYHCFEDNSYVIYGTSVSGNSIVNPTTVVSTSTIWSYDASDKDKEDGYGFAERYVCKANLTNLQPGTTYYYQAVSKSTKSEIQHFTTATDNGQKKTFLFLTDIQSSGSSFQNAENLLQVLLNKTTIQPNLVFMTGDQVDRAGIEQQWVDYYKYVPSLSNILQATIPGNHEYYLNSSGNYVSNEVYNQFYNNPLNGPSDRIGSSYYFIYDQILFIMLDTVKTDYQVNEQQEWFRNVVKNNPSQWIIVGSHPGVYATGAYYSDAKVMRRNWLKVFEECQVDLALNGHEHVYARKNNRYNGDPSSDNAGEVNEDFGITYLAGSAAGLKLYGDKAQQSLLDDYDYYDKYNNNTGCIITVSENQIEVKQYAASGQVKDEFIIKAKRPKDIENISNEEAINSFGITYDKDTEKVKITWAEELYGNVQNILIKGGFKDKDTIIVSSSKLCYKEYKVVDTTLNWNWHITLTMKDGTVLEKDLPLILNPDIIKYQITYDLDGGINNPDNPSEYCSSDLPIELKAPTKEGYEFVKWTLNGRRATDIKEGKTGDFHFVAEWKEKTKYTVTFNTDGAGEISSQTVAEGENAVEPTAPNKEGFNFLGWYNGNTKFDFSTGISKNLTLTAKYEQISTGKKNCKKSSLALILASTLLLSSCLVIFRKNK